MFQTLRLWSLGFLISSRVRTRWDSWCNTQGSAFQIELWIGSLQLLGCSLVGHGQRSQVVFVFLSHWRRVSLYTASQDLMSILVWCQPLQHPFRNRWWHMSCHSFHRWWDTWLYDYLLALLLSLEPGHRSRMVSVAAPPSAAQRFQWLVPYSSCQKPTRRFFHWQEKFKALI